MQLHNCFQALTAKVLAKGKLCAVHNWHIWFYYPIEQLICGELSSAPAKQVNLWCISTLHPPSYILHQITQYNPTNG